MSQNAPWSHDCHLGAWQLACTNDPLQCRDITSATFPACFPAHPVRTLAGKITGGWSKSFPPMHYLPAPLCLRQPLVHPPQSLPCLPCTPLPQFSPYLPHELSLCLAALPSDFSVHPPSSTVLEPCCATFAYSCPPSPSLSVPPLCIPLRPSPTHQAPLTSLMACLQATRDLRPPQTLPCLLPSPLTWLWDVSKKLLHQQPWDLINGERIAGIAVANRCNHDF